jgi:uncharacterized membrane protein (UPF0127 family)
MSWIVKAVLGVVVACAATLVVSLIVARMDAQRRGERAGGGGDAARAYASVHIRDLVVRAEVARAKTTRERGLSGRQSLAPGTGMLFVFDHLDQHSIWMREMLFSIDIIWMAGGIVVDTHERLPVPAPGAALHTLPFFTPRPQALLALEVPAGTVAAAGIQPGDRVAITFDGE